MDNNTYGGGPYFHNTVGYEGKDLERVEGKAKAQTELVMEYFCKKPFIQMTPSYVYKQLIELGLLNKKVPVTSIRRAMSDLTKEHRLRKSENTVDGPLGVKEHEWVYEPDVIVE